MHFDDETLMAYVDGELSPSEAKRVEQAMADDPALAARVARFRNVRRALRLAYDSVTREPIPERLRALLGDVASSEPAPPPRAAVVDLAQARAQAPPAPQAAQRAGPPTWAAIAATLIIGVLAGRALLPSNPFETRDGQLYAAGALSQALNTRLASDADNAASANRIGVSFRAHDGDYCRTFMQSARNKGVSGLACRTDGGWVVRVAVADQAENGVYRRAASPAPQVLSMVDDLIDGEAFDAQQERDARDHNWRRQN